MDLLPRTLEDFSAKSYWEGFFQKLGKKTLEWYGEYPELATHLHKYIKVQDEILIIGCGNSTLGRDLYDIGYSKITNIDISPTVVRQMQSQTDKIRPTLKYIQMDALNTTFSDESFSVAIDKATIDAIIPSEKEENLAVADNYFKEICRVLKSGGRYICISLLQEHVLKLILQFFPKNNFMVRVVRCFEAEYKESVNGSLPVFMVICTKFKALPNLILEIDLHASGKMKRLDTAEELQMQIANVQKVAFITMGLKRSSLNDNSEVSFDLFKDQQDTNPRYTVYVVDIFKNHQNSEYAAFIVPHGRESDWLFSTTEGRKHLVKESKFNRLAIFTMHVGHKYDSFEGLQKELEGVVVNLAPGGYKKKILFLSLGDNIGKRTVQHQGLSEFSGKYVIEDIETDRGDVFRRLYYEKTSGITQSEVKLKAVNTKNSRPKHIVDFTHLSCNHHKLMSIAVRVAIQNKQSSSALVIGLGGGGLCAFLRKFVPNTRLMAVDIDAHMLDIATNWFGLKTDRMLAVKIMEGTKFLEDAAKAGDKYNAVLFDVDSKDTSLGMSCPPKEFLELNVLENVRKLLHTDGLFVLNLVLRNKSLRPKIVNDLKANFKLVTNYDVEDDLNEIFVCGVNDIKYEVFHNKFNDASKCIETFLHKGNK